ncbi:MAG: hypothetical protein ACI9WV_000463 [Patiriisocius sp.]|jgi:hypothetical protein
MENLTYNQANSETTFSKLKTKFNIEEPFLNLKKGGFYAKKKKAHSKSKSSKDFSNLGASIDMSSLKKITTENYTSYTMRFVEPENVNNSFSNIVVQERNGVQEIFTVKYTPSKALAKTSAPSSEFEGSFTMKSGIIPYDGWDDTGDDNTGGGPDDYVEVCDEVTLIIPIPCSCPAKHMPGDFCTCYAGKPHYSYETKEECYMEYVGDYGDTGNNSNGGGTNNSNTNGSDVITTPVKEILPDGALQSIVECITPNQSQTNWLNNELANNSSNVVSIWNYINENSCDNDTQNVITESIEEDIISDEEFEEIFKRKKECKKIKKIFDEYPLYKQKLIDLSGTVNQNHENGKFIDNSSSTVQDIPQGTGGKIDINLNPSSPYVTLAHTHDALGSGIGTYSVFSFSDLLVLSSLAKKGKIKTNKFVAILITAKGTRYAITINNTTKFKNFFYNFELDTPPGGQININKLREMGDLSEKYYNEKGVITENNTDNNAVKIAFLQMLQNNDT